MKTPTHLFICLLTICVLVFSSKIIFAQIIIEGKVTYYKNKDYAIPDVKVMVFNEDNVEIGNSFTDINGQYTIMLDSSITCGKFYVLAHYDAHWPKMNVEQFYNMLLYLTYGGEIDELYFKAADPDGDNAITINDYNIFYLRVHDYIHSFSVPDYVFTTAAPVIIECCGSKDKDKYYIDTNKRRKREFEPKELGWHEPIATPTDARIRNNIETQHKVEILNSLTNDYVDFEIYFDRDFAYDAIQLELNYDKQLIDDLQISKPLGNNFTYSINKDKGSVLVTYLPLDEIFTYENQTNLDQIISDIKEIKIQEILEGKTYCKKSPYFIIRVKFSDNINNKHEAIPFRVDTKNSKILLKQSDNEGNVNLVLPLLRNGDSAPFSLLGYYPNPIDEKITIVISIIESGSLKFTLYNSQGTSVFCEENIISNGGINSLNFDIPEMPKGFYLGTIEFYSLTNNVIRKMKFVKN